jgi:23S rRNA (adenine-N6)-dimethyltransferase
MRRIPRAVGDPRLAQRRPELSQHFLRSAEVARQLVRRLPFPPASLVVEAGAGDGLITEALADAGYRVIAVEKDARLFAALQRRLAGRTNVACHCADILEFPSPRTPYYAVSNVPYGITAALIRTLLHAARPPDGAALIVQREAAEKFAGTPRETLFSLLWKPYYEIAIACAIPRRDFVPPPRVGSALLLMQRRDVPLIAAAGTRAYRSFVATALGHGSADVAPALRRYLTSRQIKRLAHDLGFAATARTSQLTFDQWLSIFRFVEHECLGHDPTRRTPRCDRHRCGPFSADHSSHVILSNAKDLPRLAPRLCAQHRPTPASELPRTHARVYGC